MVTVMTDPILFNFCDSTSPGIALFCLHFLEYNLKTAIARRLELSSTKIDFECIISTTDIPDRISAESEDQVCTKTTNAVIIAHNSVVIIKG